MTTDNQEFSPGETVLLEHTGPGCYPDTPVTIIEKMVDKMTPCHVCGHLWHGYTGPDYWKQNPSYLIEYSTGARGTIPARRLRKIEEGKHENH
jgi:hypothetical protein